MPQAIFVGCAGWSIPKDHAAAFPADGSHLARYAQRFNTVEINSSFYRPHRRATYERWAATVPAGFSFAVKIPREITHRMRLSGAEAALDAFLEQATGLGDKLGPLLLQLPPSLTFDEERAGTFFTALRGRYEGSVACEPRHPGWFTPQAEAMLRDAGIARVEADPPVLDPPPEAGGWPGLYYLRLHGSPKMYYSEYSTEDLAHAAGKLAIAQDTGRDCWCVFDNTAAGAAIPDALALQALLGKR